MDVHFYFWITIIAFLVFICFPLFILAPYRQRRESRSADLVRELRKLKFNLQHPEQAFYQIRERFGATAYDVSLLGKQCYYELMFRSVADSIKFKRQAVSAGICSEKHITIIREKSMYTVIFQV